MKSITTLKSFIVATMFALTVGAVEASACSFFINNQAQENDLIAATATHLKLSLADVESIEINGYRWFISIDTPMCPEEITHQATVTLRYVDQATQKNCVATLDAENKDSWKDRTQNYSFVGLPACNRAQ